MQAAEGSDPGDRDRDGVWHPADNPVVEKDPLAADLADVDQPAGVLILSPTPTEPKVTDVTAASAARVLIRDHHGIRARMLGQPAPGLVVEGDEKLHSLHH